jgi:hypothetical protein
MAGNVSGTKVLLYLHEFFLFKDNNRYKEKPKWDELYQSNPGIEIVFDDDDDYEDDNDDEHNYGQESEDEIEAESENESEDETGDKIGSDGKDEIED